MQGGRTVAFFPFQYRSRVHAAIGIGQCLGGEISDYFGLIAEAGFHIEVADLLRLSGLKSIFFTQLDENRQSDGLIGARREVGHLIDFPYGGRSFWEEKQRNDKKFVSDTERRERNLGRDIGLLSFEYCADDKESALEKVIAEKRAQYHRTGVKDALSEKRVRAMLHTLCQTRDPQCSGVVSTLYAGTTWVASHFGLRSGSTLHYWFPVYNPALRAFAPGRILLKQIILASQFSGLVRIDRGAGDSGAKRDLSTSRHFFCSGLWQRPGAIAMAHRVGFAIEWRLACYTRPRKTDS
jgi:CelD/BcsL family acetyltransferase involved in cellulose biosynthesis